MGEEVVVGGRTGDWLVERVDCGATANGWWCVKYTLVELFLLHLANSFSVVLLLNDDRYFAG